MRFRGLVYRAHSPQWSWEPLSGEGARRCGGRFNRRGVAALYTSLDPLGALREAQPLGRPMQPLTLRACEVDVEPVFDALDGRELQTLRVSEAELASSTWEEKMLRGTIPESQACADRLIAAGYAGMRVRSLAVGAGTDDHSLVLWRWGADLPTRVILIDDEGRLSRRQASRSAIRES